MLGIPRAAQLAAILAAVTAIAVACGGGDPPPEFYPGPEASAMPTASSASSDLAVRDGDTVLVHYHGTLDSGEVFDSSRDGEPLSFAVGAGQVIEGFDEAVLGLSVGESVTRRMEPEQAYGARRDDLILDVPLANAPEGVQPGNQVRAANGAVALVLNVTDEFVRIDANHPLAGLALTFEIELVSIDRPE